MASKASAVAGDLQGVGEVLELRRSRTRGLQVAGGGRDLDLCRKTPQASEQLVDLGEAAGDCRDGGVELAFGEAEQRQPGLGIAAKLVRLAVGLLRGSGIPEPPTDLADLVIPAGTDQPVEVLKLLAQPTGRSPPRAARREAA